MMLMRVVVVVVLVAERQKQERNCVSVRRKGREERPSLFIPVLCSCLSPRVCITLSLTRMHVSVSMCSSVCAGIGDDRADGARQGT